MSQRNAIKVLFEDQYLLIIDKPAGLLSIPSRDASEDSVWSGFRSIYPDLHVVHRLDRDTSGVLVFAKDAPSHRHLSAQFEHHTVRKLYLAIVAGHAGEMKFTIDNRLTIDAHGRVSVSSKGKHAVTHVRVAESFAGYALVEAAPITGRQHQIRVHLSHAGLPLAVDPLYSSPVPITIADIKRSRALKYSSESSGVLLGRTPLHAREITFRHPASDEDVTFSSDLPKDMRALLNQLRKWSH